METQGDEVTVKVDAQLMAGLLPGVHLLATAHTLLEPGVSDAGS